MKYLQNFFSYNRIEIITICLQNGYMNTNLNNIRKELNYLIPEINQALMKYKDIFLTFFHPDTLVNESPSRAID